MILNVSAIALSMGQTIILTTIMQQLQGQIPGLTSEQVFTAGAANLPAIAPTPEALDILRQIWNAGIRRGMMLSVAFVGAAVPFTLAMEWLNAKQVALARQEAERQSTQEKGEAVAKECEVEDAETGAIEAPNLRQ